MILHGLGGDAREYATNFTSWIDLVTTTKKTTQCFTVVFPQALKYAEIQGRSAWTGADDWKFLEAIIEYLTKEYSQIDSKKVHAVGVSNGGFYLCDEVGPKRIGTLFASLTFFLGGCSQPSTASEASSNSDYPRIPVLVILATKDYHHYSYQQEAYSKFKSLSFPTTSLSVNMGHEYNKTLESSILDFVLDPEYR
eukprot:TRINITY_DN2347_c0_g1_i1.p1 TRINITY_DN2347_c0_g1~~TRINITY_DN2347_c0_g1_i1.p1  ORF type:complete len:195 (+),score=32.02 TRINITY_DN2347_c0_g1_i1:328-912(+)